MFKIENQDKNVDIVIKVLLWSEEIELLKYYQSFIYPYNELEIVSKETQTNKNNERHANINSLEQIKDRIS